MAKKMLIDATHPEETRVVVLDGSKVDEFDFESINKRQLAGNIYLAKVTRVEPSLQAAFVDYGGNRHGFLAFSEIHPDYYQIPVADREALLAEEAAENRAEAEDDDRNNRKRKSRSRRGRGDRKAKSAESVGSMDVIDADAADDNEPVEVVENRRAGPKAEAEAEAPAEVEAAAAEPEETWEAAAPEAANETGPEAADENETAPKSIAESAGADGSDRVTEEIEGDVAESEPEPAEASEEAPAKTPRRSRSRSRRKPAAPAPAAEAAAATADEDRDDEAEETPDAPESVAAEDVQEEIAPRRVRARRYKIQEVVKVRQIMLVQVVKEERGNKGAALTTYLSLAGRYCVLMPNTARGGGISRKITSAADRSKLKDIADEIEVPKGMGLIIRTAGAKRTRAEIKRDYEYLLRQWEEIRELTLKSIAPALIYEEGSLIKRTIRDLYSRDIESIMVEGEEGYREAKDYMKMLMPSHAKHVQRYDDPVPLFIRHQVESDLASMFNPVVQLKSGGYIVIGITEALVAIDINSGRSTKEHSIEETALKTNLEAADEISRQLRLRDLAGLIVIDFIDMEDNRNNRAVEKRMKERLKTDRARIQIGRISAFGLMEMSRQRLRPGMLEASTAPCAHCHGTGLTRSDESSSLSILRALEEDAVRSKARELVCTAPVSIVNFLMNQKRDHLIQIEARSGVAIRVEADPLLISPDYKIERLKTATRAPASAGPVVRAESVFADVEDEPEAPEAPKHPEGRDDREGRDRRRRDEDRDNGDRAAARETAPASAEEDGEREGGRRRRGRRGGRRRKRSGEREHANEDAVKAAGEDAGTPEAQTDAQAETPAKAAGEAVAEAPAETVESAPEAAEPAGEAAAEKKPRRTRRRKPKAEAAPEPEAAEPEAAEAAPEAVKVAEVPEPEAAPESEPKPVAASVVEAAPEPEPEPETAPEPEPVLEAEPKPDRPKRRGWWSLR
jgi:ribonuclease E